MANATAHRIGAAVAVGAALAHAEKERGESSLKPVAGAGLAAMLGTLPDKIEPAVHPQHRQFFPPVPPLSAKLGSRATSGNNCTRSWTWR